ncbi:MAG: tyrosine recombinase [Phycisphaerae bacterium]
MSHSPQKTPSASPPELPRLLKGFLDYLQAECGLSVNTRKAYRHDLLRFEEYLASASIAALADLTPTHIDAFLRYLRGQELAMATIARALAAVRMFCRFLVLQQVLTTDVSACLEAPRKWNRLPAVLGSDDARKLLAEPREDLDPLAARDRAILTVLYATGMRASELAGLKTTDVNESLGVIRVLGKGNKERIVPIAAAALQTIRDYLPCRLPNGKADADPRQLFLSRTGKPISREDIYRTVRKYARRAGLRGKVGAHTLRHCFATHLLSGGADLRSVQEMLGHADISTTQIYTHVDADRLKAIHRKFHPRG